MKGGSEIVRKAKETKIIVVVNPKGGVGKTFIALNLGYYLAGSYGDKILFIDLNPWAHLSLLTLGEEKYLQYCMNPAASTFISTLINTQKPTIHEALSFIKDLSYERTSLFENLKTYLIPSNINLIEVESYGWKNPDYLYSLKNFFQELGINYPFHLPHYANDIEDEENINPHDPFLQGNDVYKEFKTSNLLNNEEDPISYVIIDTPPCLGVLTTLALAAAHSVIIPITPDYLSLQHLSSFLTYLCRMKKINKYLLIEGIVINGYDPRLKSHRNFEDNLSEQLNFVKTNLFFPKPIRKSKKVLEAFQKCLPILVYDSEALPALDIIALGNEIIKKNGRSHLVANFDEYATQLVEHRR